MSTQRAVTRLGFARSNAAGALGLVGVAFAAWVFAGSGDAAGNRAPAAALFAAGLGPAEISSLTDQPPSAQDLVAAAEAGAPEADDMATATQRIVAIQSERRTLLAQARFDPVEHAASVQRLAVLDHELATARSDLRTHSSALRAVVIQQLGIDPTEASLVIGDNAQAAKRRISAEWRRAPQSSNEASELRHALGNVDQAQDVGQAAPADDMSTVATFAGRPGVALARARFNANYEDTARAFFALDAAE